jgi:hypothetical protein
MARNRWDDKQIEVLKGLIACNLSLARAAVIMKRPQTSVQIQARKLGTPFPGIRAVKATLKARIEAAEKKASLR